MNKSLKISLVLSIFFLILVLIEYLVTKLLNINLLINSIFSLLVGFFFPEFFNFLNKLILLSAKRLKKYYRKKL
jgi:hypothetical protein